MRMDGEGVVGGSRGMEVAVIYEVGVDDGIEAGSNLVRGIDKRDRWMSFVVSQEVVDGVVNVIIHIVIVPAEVNRLTQSYMG